MKKIILLLAILFVLGCGGGNPITSSPRDLSGLEGVWYGSMTVKGNIDYTASPDGKFPAHTDPVEDTFPLEWHFTKDSITNGPVTAAPGARFKYNWSYDGTILTLKYENKSEMGGSTLHNVNIMTIPIYPTATSGIITGTSEQTWTSQNYGSSYGVLAINGNIHR